MSFCNDYSRINFHFGKVIWTIIQEYVYLPMLNYRVNIYSINICVIKLRITEYDNKFNNIDLDQLRG
jgi:hypothetical protein